MSILVDDAFVQAFIDGDYELPIVHENQRYIPEQGTPFAELIVLHNPRTPVAIASTDIMTGIFRVILRYPEFEGAIPAKKKAEDILADFAINTIVTSQGQASRVTETQRERGVPEDGWFKLVLSIFFETIIQRT